MRMLEETHPAWLVNALSISYELLNKLLHQMWKNSYEFLVKEAPEVHKTIQSHAIVPGYLKTREVPVTQVIKHLVCFI